MDTIENRSKLIEYLYRVAIEPERYDDLMSAWDGVLSVAAKEGASNIDDAELERHVLQASTILQRLGDIPVPPEALALSINRDPNPALLIDDHGTVVAINQAAGIRFSLKLGEKINDLDAQKENLQSALNQLSSKTSDSAALAGLFEVLCKDKPDKLMLALSVAECPHDNKVAGLLSTLAPAWSPQIIEALRHHFSLSPVETDIVHRLARGQDIRKISDARGKSINTVRTQVKTILRKTKLDSQVELVRFAGFLERFNQPDDAPYQPTEKPGKIYQTEKNFLQTNTGTRLEYTIVGPSDGRPVLFIHGMLDGCSLTQEGLKQLHRRNICFIAPSRPCFGNSDPDLQPGDRAWNLAGMVEQLLDELGIERLLVIGHMAGSVYAANIAARLKNRITGIFNVGGGVPIISHKQFAMMSPRQRLIAQTAVNAPALLPMFLKAGIILLRSGGADTFLNALYREAPVDLAIASQPEVKAYLYEGYLFATVQGHKAFQFDALEVTRNWRDITSKVTCPIMLVHGCHDPVVRIETVRDYVAQSKNCQLVESETSGQLILASQPELVFNELDKFMERTENQQA